MYVKLSLLNDLLCIVAKPYKDISHKLEKTSYRLI